MKLKLAGYLLGGACVLVLGWILNGWRVDSNRLPLVEKELSDERANVAQIKKDAKVVADASTGYQSELALLRSGNASRPGTPVRLCQPARPASVRVPATEPGPDGGAAAAGMVSRDTGVRPEEGPAAAGGDIGPDLRALGNRADRVNAQARGLQKQADGLAPK